MDILKGISGKDLHVTGLQEFLLSLTGIHISPDIGYTQLVL